MNAIEFDSEALTVLIQPLLDVPLDFAVCKANIVRPLFVQLLRRFRHLVVSLFQLELVAVERFNFRLDVIIVSLDLLLDLFESVCDMVKVLQVVPALPYEASFESVLAQHFGQALSVDRHQVPPLLVSLQQLT